MKSKRLIWSLYDIDVGDYDEYNPRYVYSRKMVPEISYVIASNPPFSLSSNDIIDMLEIETEVCNHALEAMLKINAISVRDEKYKINFTAFLEEDLIILSDFCGKVGKTLSERIISLKDKIDLKIKKLRHYDNCEIERIRYQVIGCETLDGGAMDYFAEKGLITTSKKQPGNRDYLIIANEESHKLRDYSNKLLCSCNMCYSGNVGIGSFGDADGLRKDMMRFFRRVHIGIENVTEYEKLNLSYIKLVDNFNKTIIKKSSSLIVKALNEDISYIELLEEDKTLVDFLKELGYVDYDKDNKILCCVPVFEGKDMEIISEISNLITDNIYDIVREAINTLDKNLVDIASVKHGVDFKDIANELWHLIFGATNEELVNTGFFSRPEYKEGEGRYFQFLTIT